MRGRASPTLRGGRKPRAHRGGSMGERKEKGPPACTLAGGRFCREYAHHLPFTPGLTLMPGDLLLVHPRKDDRRGRARGGICTPISRMLGPETRPGMLAKLTRLSAKVS